MLRKMEGDGGETKSEERRQRCQVGKRIAINGDIVLFLFRCRDLTVTCRG